MSSVEAPLLDSALAAGPAAGGPFYLGVGRVPISVMEGLNLSPHESAFQDDIILGEDKSVFALTALGVANVGGRRVVEHLHHVDLISPSPGHLNNRIIKSPITRSWFSIDAPNQFLPNVSALQRLVRALLESSATDMNLFLNEANLPPCNSLEEDDQVAHLVALNQQLSRAIFAYHNRSLKTGRPKWHYLACLALSVVSAFGFMLGLKAFADLMNPEYSDSVKRDLLNSSYFFMNHDRSEPAQFGTTDIWYAVNCMTRPDLPCYGCSQSAADYRRDLHPCAAAIRFMAPRSSNTSDPASHLQQFAGFSNALAGGMMFYFPLVAGLITSFAAMKFSDKRIVALSAFVGYVSNLLIQSLTFDKAAINACLWVVNQDVFTYPNNTVNLLPGWDSYNELAIPTAVAAFSGIGYFVIPLVSIVFLYKLSSSYRSSRAVSHERDQAVISVMKEIHQPTPRELREARTLVATHSREGAEAVTAIRDVLAEGDVAVDVQRQAGIPTSRSDVSPGAAPHAPPFLVSGSSTPLL